MNEKKLLEQEERIEEFAHTTYRITKRKSKKNVSMNDNPFSQKTDQVFKTTDNTQTSPQIKILNKPLNNHTNHPINKIIKQINAFCYLTFVKANQNILPKNIKFDN